MEVTRRRSMWSGVRWVNHYSSVQTILVVGDGDFSFSLALAAGFGSGVNIVATSLDSYEALIRKYSKAELNVIELKRLGAKVLHGINAKTMKRHTYLEMRLFDRIIFNFPHAGFKGQEYESYAHVIQRCTREGRYLRLHRELVKGFFCNAQHLLQPYGEIHISHKTGYPYDEWNLEQLASESSLIMIDKVSFQKHDYPGYNQKKRDGPKCNQSFPLRDDSCTFKFCMKHKDKLH